LDESATKDTARKELLREGKAKGFVKKALRFIFNRFRGQKIKIPSRYELPPKS